MTVDYSHRPIESHQQADVKFDSGHVTRFLSIISLVLPFLYFFLIYLSFHTMASIVADQSSITQLAELHSQQASNTVKQAKVKGQVVQCNPPTLFLFSQLYVHQEKKVNLKKRKAAK